MPRQGKLKISGVSINKLIVDIVKSVKVNPEFSEISVNINESEEELNLKADPYRVKQVFLDIITNACEAVEESEIKNITINLKKENDSAIVEITDTGCGNSRRKLRQTFYTIFHNKENG
ncbi:MAG: ATP-binding protein [Melioribacteraceae bacterium]|nr:ATP-binding protein [Melioribacteraceae bacterium]